MSDKLKVHKQVAPDKLTCARKENIFKSQRGDVARKQSTRGGALHNLPGYSVRAVVDESEATWKCETCGNHKHPYQAAQQQFLGPNFDAVPPEKPPL